MASPLLHARGCPVRERPFPPLEQIHTIAFDFDGVFTDNGIWLDQDGRESVRCDRRDGLALDLVRAYRRRGRLNAHCFILSTEVNAVVAARARKMKLDCHQGVANKLDFMLRHLRGRFPQARDPFSGLVYLGNDINDLPLMRRAGYAVAPADAHPLVCEAANLVMDRRGGDAFVRAFVERLLRIAELSPEDIDELVSDC